MRFLDTVLSAYRNNIVNSFCVWKFIIVMWCVKSAMPLFPWWLEQRCNMLNWNFKGIVSSVLICWMFRYFHFPHFGDLKTRFLDIVHSAYPNSIVTRFCVWKFIIVKWNLSILIIPWWLERTCSRTNLPNSNFKGIVSSVLFCRVFQYVHFQCFRELKTRFLYIVHLA